MFTKNRSKTKIILNADDFAMDEGVSRAIINLLLLGTISSTSVMVNGKYFYKGISELKTMKIDSVGVHLNITEGQAISDFKQVSDLVNSEGFFKSAIDKFDNRVLAQIEIELIAQIDLFIKSFGNPSHLDAHHHFYLKNIKLLKLYSKLSKKYSLPIRKVYYRPSKTIKSKSIITSVRGSVKYIIMNSILHYYYSKAFRTEIKETRIDFYGESFDLGYLISELNLIHKKSDIIEIMLHPGYSLSVYDFTKDEYGFREKEYNILNNKKVIEFLKENFILIGYNDLNKY